MPMPPTAQRLESFIFNTLESIGGAKRKNKFLAQVVSLNPCHGEHMPLISAAYDLSAAAHRHQFRYNNQRPYHSHCRGVGLLLAPEFPSSYVAAGLLHDVVEDTPVPLDRIIHEFGAGIAGMVGTMTELPAEIASEPPMGKIAHIRRIVTTDHGAAIPIALADKLHNLRDPLSPGWRQRTSAYVMEYLLFSVRGLASPAGKPYDEHTLYRSLVHEAESASFPPLSEQA